jgi:hypothetical protein
MGLNPIFGDRDMTNFYWNHCRFSPAKSCEPGCPGLCLPETPSALPSLRLRHQKYSLNQCLKSSCSPSSQTPWPATSSFWRTSELLKLGYDVAEATVTNYLVNRNPSPSQSWPTFLRNHLTEIVAIDFFTVPTATFGTLYVFLVLSLDRRRIVHFNVTDSPTAEWTSRQPVQAFPFDTAPRFLIRDRDSIYGEEVVEKLRLLGVEQKLISYESPWQNGYCGSTSPTTTDRERTSGWARMRRSRGRFSLEMRAPWLVSLLSTSPCSTEEDAESAYVCNIADNLTGRRSSSCRNHPMPGQFLLRCAS